MSFKSATAAAGVLLSCALNASQPASASEQSGKVIQVGADTGNPVVFLVSGTRTSTPSCATDGFFALPSTSTDQGKAILSIVLTAFAANKTMNVHGAGTCVAFPTREDVAWLIVE